MMKFKDKVAIVTGAGRGIGQGIAMELATEGASLVLCGRTLTALEETADAIRKGFPECQILCIPTDVGDVTSVESCIEKTMQMFGKIDILVNNAGITRDRLLIRMTDDDWDEVLRINLKGAFLFCRAVAKIMMKARSGVIINVSSVIGLIGNAGQCNYASAKAGLIAMTQSMAKELASRGIRVNAIAPGFIVSQMTDALPQKVKDQMLENIPLGRLGEARDIARSVTFLASNDADYITGTTLNVSGGMVI